MTTRANRRRLVLDYAQRVWNDHDLTAVDDFVPEQTLLRSHDGDTWASRSGMKERIAEVLLHIPDHRIDVFDIVVADDGGRVVFRWETSGHWSDGDRGAFAVQFGGMTYWRIVDDLITERDGFGDIATFAWQMRVFAKRHRILLAV